MKVTVIDPATAQTIAAIPLDLPSYIPMGSQLGEMPLDAVDWESSWWPALNANPSLDLPVSNFVGHEVTIIGWINKALTPIPPTTGVTTALVSNLTGGISCGTELRTWSKGERLDIRTDADLQYADMFLLANSANAEPPPQLDKSDSWLKGGDFAANEIGRKCLSPVYFVL